MLPTRNLDGDAWDLGGGAPDPQVSVFVNSELTCNFAMAQDAFEYEWTGLWCPPVTLREGDVINVELYDVDATSDDFIGTCEVLATAAEMRDGWFGCEGGGISMMSILIVPE